jgi:hypothetical protein
VAEEELRRRVHDVAVVFNDPPGMDVPPSSRPPPSRVDISALKNVDTRDFPLPKFEARLTT